MSMRLTLTKAAYAAAFAFCAGCGASESPKPDRPAAEKFCVLQTPTKRMSAPYVAVCGEASRQDCLLAVAKSGARAVCPIPPKSFLVEATAAHLEKLRSDGHFSDVRELRPEEKVAEGFVSGIARITVLTEADRLRMTAFVEDHGGGLVASDDCRRTEFCAKLTVELVKALSAKGEVRRIRP